MPVPVAPGELIQIDQYAFALNARLVNLNWRVPPPFTRKKQFVATSDPILKSRIVVVFPATHEIATACPPDALDEIFVMPFPAPCRVMALLIVIAVVHANVPAGIVIVSPSAALA
jgi:hypothetical protein